MQQLFIECLQEIDHKHDDLWRSGQRSGLSC